MKPAIRIENLSKLYHIGARQHAGYRTLRESLTHAVSRPWRHLRQLNPQSAIRTPQSPDSMWALRDVSFDVQPGEVVGIIGRNGAGKSTLLKILSRITEPTSGRALIHGRVGSLLEVGTGFHPELTGRENIYMNGTILGMTKREIDRQFDEIVDFSGVEKFLDTPVKRYSSGMQVRLAFAVAAHLEPEILIIDEVLAVGDAEFQKKCLGKMQDVAHSGRTVLFVSHNLGSVRLLCHCGIVMQNGRIGYTGDCDEAISYYDRTLSHLSAVRVAERGDREGIGLAQITDFRVRNRLGEVTNSICLGEPAMFEIDYECSEPLYDSLVAIGIIHPTLGPLAQLNSRFCGTRVDLLPPGGTIATTISRLALAPQSYSLNVALASAPLGINYDQVSGVLTLDVLAGDFFRSGVVPGASVGPMVVEHHWEPTSH